MAISVYRANDKYRATLRSTWISSPAATSLAVTALPTNYPTIVTVGWNTEYETVFTITGVSGTDASNYTLTGVTRSKGANVNIPEGTAVNCLNHEEFFNQYETEINSILEGNFDAGLDVADDINIATDKNITVNDVDPWRTITLNAGVLKPTTTAGCAAVATVEAGTNDIDYDVIDFDKATDENAFVNFQMPDSWDAGVVQFRYTWTAAAGTASQNVVMELSGISLANDDAIDAAVGTPVEVSDALIATGDIHTSAWSSDVTLAGTPAAGEWVHLELMRDVSEDNLDADARIINVQLRYKQAKYSD